MLNNSICYLDAQAEARLSALLQRHCSVDGWAAVRPCIPRLINLLLETESESIDSRAITVQMVLAEQVDAGECGDDCTHDPHELHRLVEQTLAAMADLQRQWRREGHGCSAEVPPIMFG